MLEGGKAFFCKIFETLQLTKMVYIATSLTLLLIIVLLFLLESKDIPGVIPAGCVLRQRVQWPLGEFFVSSYSHFPSLH